MLFGVTLCSKTVKVLAVKGLMVKVLRFLKVKMLILKVDFKISYLMKVYSLFLLMAIFPKIIVKPLG